MLLHRSVIPTAVIPRNTPARMLNTLAHPVWSIAIDMNPYVVSNVAMSFVLVFEAIGNDTDQHLPLKTLFKVKATTGPSHQKQWHGVIAYYLIKIVRPKLVIITYGRQSERDMGLTMHNRR